MKTDIFKKAGAMIKRTYGIAKFNINAKKPEILMVGGFVCIVTGTVLACRATLTAGEVIDDYKKNLKNVNDIVNNGVVEVVDEETGEKNFVKIPEEEYTLKDAQKDKVVATGQMVGGLVKKYAMPATLTALGILLICKSHSIMSERVAGAVAAYESCKSAFEAYRERVKSEVGEEKENEIYYGYKKVVQDSDGNIKTEYVYQDKDAAENTFIFSKETSKEWEPSASYNKLTIKQVENMANARLQAYGYVMMFEVLDMLGMERTPQSYMLGWCEDNGDGFISLGVFEGNNPRNQRFVAGLEKDCVIHMNVDGVIQNIRGVKIRGPYNFAD